MGISATKKWAAWGRSAGLLDDPERILREIPGNALEMRPKAGMERALGLARLFVLTTRTGHWFLKRGFVVADVEQLPMQRQKLYNWQRRSQVLVKAL